MSIDSGARGLAVTPFKGDSGSGGAVGAVPAPATGDAAAGKYLKADGTWYAVTTGTITNSPGGSTGAVQKNGGGTFAAATAGTDYVAPGGALGTPSSGVATNLTGTAAGLTAGAVSTINGLISAGSNVTITGSGTSGSPYSIASSGGSSVNLSTPNVWTGQQNFGTATLTDGATVSWNLNTQQVARVTLGGNRTIANPTNLVDGGTYVLEIVQDGTGSRTVSWGANYKWMNSGGAAPTLSTAAGAVDVVMFYSDGTYMYGCPATAAGTGGGGSMTYPGAGIANSTGSAWGTSYTTSGSGTVLALATSPSLTTPTLGVAIATSINRMAITAPATASTLAVADGKTATINNTLTFTGTDSSSVAFGTGGTVVYSTDARLTGFAGNNTQNANYTIVSGDVGKVVRHTDASNYTYTLDTYANQPVAANQAITISCESTGTLTIAAPSGGSLIRLDGTAGTGNRTVGAASVATLYKLDGANAWAIWGTALS